MSSIWGRRFVVDIFGESHGPRIGVTIHGAVPGTPFDADAARTFLDRRRAGGDVWSTPRREADEFEIVSGLYNGRLTGTPLCALFANADTRSRDYDAQPPRPGHADYTGHVRYRGFNDPRGGGHFSGRLTAPLVFAGAVAAQTLSSRGVYAATHVRRIADVEDAPFDRTYIPLPLAQRLAAQRLPLLNETQRPVMEQRIADAAFEGDSIGGVVECALCGLPAGLGSPMFGTCESALSSLLFAVPAVKGVSFGAGFGFADMRGSAANDAYDVQDGRVVTRTNHNGGVLGGITTGMPVVFEAAIKPTASISLPQQSVDPDTLEARTLAIRGRHDACIVPRAAVAVEAAALIFALDLLLEEGTYGI